MSYSNFWLKRRRERVRDFVYFHMKNHWSSLLSQLDAVVDDLLSAHQEDIGNMTTDDIDVSVYQLPFSP